MRLIELLDLIDSEYFPFVRVDTIPSTDTELCIRFNAEDECCVLVNIESPILIPWYNCEVKCIEPDNNNSIGVWLHAGEYIKQHVPEYFIDPEDKTFM